MFGVSVQTGVILVEYMNQLRARGYPAPQAARDGAIQRFRPILMTMLVASLGLVPAATSHGIGSDSQRPFAIVIVGGLMAVLMMSIFLLPSLYVWFAREGDRLPEADLRARRRRSDAFAQLLLGRNACYTSPNRREFMAKYMYQATYTLEGVRGLLKETASGRRRPSSPRLRP